MTKRRSRWRLLGRVIMISMGLFIFWLFAIWPPPLWYRVTFPRETAFQAMRRHQDPVAAEQRRYTPVPMEAISPLVNRAVLVAEDHRFYTHSGMDFVELRKALGYRRDSFDILSERDRTEMLRGLSQSELADVRGASTITQQLAKNLYLSPSRNPLRKVKEMVTAFRLEMWLGKDRILELYLNTAELGDEVWGVEAASQLYFKKSAARLTRVEAATLAATLPAPTSSNPRKRSGRMLWKRDWILNRM
jgi:monofunctional glycosyltransferase